jgi:transposase-like protein
MEDKILNEPTKCPRCGKEKQRGDIFIKDGDKFICEDCYTEICMWEEESSY